MNLSNKKRKKAATTGAVLLAIMLTMSACGENSSNQGSDNQPTIPSSAPTDQLPEQSGVLEPGAPSNDGDNPSTDNEENPSALPSQTTEPISGEGVYTGQIDSNSIEITTASGAAAYRIPEELASVIETLPSDANVKFEYTETTIEGDDSIKQLWLTKIEVTQ